MTVYRTTEPLTHISTVLDGRRVEISSEDDSPILPPGDHDTDTFAERFGDDCARAIAMSLATLEQHGFAVIVGNPFAAPAPEVAAATTAVPQPVEMAPPLPAEGGNPDSTGITEAAPQEVV